MFFRSLSLRLLSLSKHRSDLGNYEATLLDTQRPEKSNAKFWSTVQNLAFDFFWPSLSISPPTKQYVIRQD